MDYRLLAAFKSLFEGRQYRHRSSAQGDRVALEIYEDLFNLRKSKAFTDDVTSREKVVSTQAKRKGTFGELMPGMQAVVVPGFNVARGAASNIEIGVDAKFFAKAMNKQVGRVVTVLKDRLAVFHKGAANPICIAIVGINCADYSVSYEGDREWRTDGRRHKHPLQEAADIERRMNDEIKPKFTELVILKYKATNEPPYPFEWVQWSDTLQDYGTALSRISREYDLRFG